MSIPTNEVICGDCLQIMPQIPDNSIDMVFCDPPYQKTKLSWDSLIPFNLLWDQYNRIVKKDGVVVFTAAQPFTTTLINSNLKYFRQALVWDKGKGSNPLLAKKRIMQAHEDVIIFCRGSMPYYPQLSPGKAYTAPRTGGNRTNSIVGAKKDKDGFRQQDNTGFRYPLSVLKYSIHCGSKLHPTEKPISLIEFLIKTYTKRGDTVLDNCAGSFSTAIAAFNTDRHWICIEKEEKYCEIGRKRIEEHIPCLIKKYLR